jgi:hypothetical protein
MTTEPKEETKQKLIGAIRSYVHMDNLVESLNKQASNARTVRAKHEAEAIGYMKRLGLGGSMIQVSGAALQLKQHRVPSSLTWGYLTEQATAWCASSGIPVMKAKDLVKWLQDHREIKETEVLHKTSGTITAGPKTAGPK